MHYVTFPLIFSFFSLTKYHNILHTEDNLYKVQTTKYTTTLYQTDTIRPSVFCCAVNELLLVISGFLHPLLQSEEAAP